MRRGFPVTLRNGIEAYKVIPFKTDKEFKNHGFKQIIDKLYLIKINLL